jgi:hypothetical protein
MKKDTSYKEKNVYWRDNTGDYHAYSIDMYEKPIIEEKEGCWGVSIKLKQ